MSSVFPDGTDNGGKLEFHDYGLKMFKLTRLAQDDHLL